MRMEEDGVYKENLKIMESYKEIRNVKINRGAEKHIRSEEFWMEKGLRAVFIVRSYFKIVLSNVLRC